jgi:hypothetical protein
VLIEQSPSATDRLYSLRGGGAALRPVNVHIRNRRRNSGELPHSAHDSAAPLTGRAVTVRARAPRGVLGRTTIFQLFCRVPPIPMPTPHTIPTTSNRPSL